MRDSSQPLMSNHAYRFTINDANVVTLVEEGDLTSGGTWRWRVEEIDENEAYQVVGGNVVKTETEHGKIETEVYTATDGLYFLTSTSGSERDDTYLGGSRDDSLRGGAGNDLIHGDDGNDDLWGDVGDDRLFGELGNDTLHGGSGNDVLQTGDGDDHLHGDDGNDVLGAGFGNDDITGDGGRDFIRGGNGRDSISGGAGADELWGDFGRNSYSGEVDGSDDLIVVKSDQYLYNALYGKAGNNADGAKADVIGKLELNDRIRILGVSSSGIHISAVTKTLGDTSYSGLGIEAGGYLEAIYTGGNLTIAQLAGIVSGDDSAAVMNNTQGFYGSAL